MGTGIWSMHFIGMQAFSLPIELGYDLATTLVSLIAAIVVAALALYVSSRRQMGLKAVVVGAALIEVIRNSLILLGISTFWQGTFVGSFIVIAVLFDRVRARGANE